MLLLLLGKLMLFNSLHKFVRVSHDLRDEVMLIIVFKVVDFLKVFVVLSSNTFYICNETFVLKVKTPIFTIVVSLGSK